MIQAQLIKQGEDMNQQTGKAFFYTSINKRQNQDPSAKKMQNMYDNNLRSIAKDTTAQDQANEIKRLKAELAKLKK